MVARKLRTPVVLDTNVLVRSIKARSNASANRRLVRLWLMERRLQLIVSPEILAKYLDIFDRVLGLSAETIAAWRRRFENDRRTTMVRLGRRYTESRDPDDNLMLATARSGSAEYLITNDRDLLNIPMHLRRAFPFEILSPGESLKRLRNR